MSEHTLIQHINCAGDNTYRQRTYTDCPQTSQVESNKLQVFANEALDPSGGCKDAVEKGNVRSELLGLLAVLGDIFFAHQTNRNRLNPNGNGSPPLLIYKANGCSVQPVLWHPDFTEGKK
jgi:hypothetical protein